MAHISPFESVEPITGTPVPPVPSQSTHPLLLSPLPLSFSSSSSSSSSSKPIPDFNLPASPSLPSLPQDDFLHAHRQSHNSSKLPAFRFVDLKKESIAQPFLLQYHYRHQKEEEEEQLQQQLYIGLDHQPSETQATTVNQLFSARTVPKNETTHNRNSNYKIVLLDPPSEKSDPVRSQTSSSQVASSSLPVAASFLNRSVSLDAPTNVPPSTRASRLPPKPIDTAVPVLKRRAPTSPLIPLGQDTTAASSGLPTDLISRKKTPGQRGYLLSRDSTHRTAPNDKRVSVQSKPPLSYKPSAHFNGSSPSSYIPPIRSYRSPGERRSLVLDMNVGSARNHDTAENHSDQDHRNRTLRALEGRRESEAMQWTSLDSARDRPDGEDSGDLFLKIAREDSSQQRTATNGRTYADSPNIISRVARTARRPLSAAISSYQSPSYRSPSPPNLSRRLSEQESSRARGPNQEQGEKAAPPVSYRAHSREPQSEEFKFRGANTPVRASPLAQRTFTFQVPSDSASGQRRRQPSVEQTPAALPRMASLKQANVNYSHPRAYNSSPLVPQTADSSRQDAPSNEPVPADGTDSTTSTAAPSTVWDELEELKSRIHRLELTGKLPPTSNAAISRASDERPPTAHTNATTLSSSPKRAAPSIVQSVETVPKESHALLHSALAKSKGFLAPDIYDALEAATFDALALAAMMGTAGQPGPISSGASTIGSSTGTVTDRQLRKKTDSVCRSLTELCLALNEHAVPNRPQQLAAQNTEDDTVTDPTITPFSVMAAQRRPSAPANRVEFVTSPRAAPRSEEKRVQIVPASPRYGTNISKSTDGTPSTPGRKSSLLFTRNRRAGTEEAEDGRRISAIARNRRAVTEEQEDQSDRKPIITRGRRGTMDESEDEFGARIPSRAITEVNGFRTREYTTQLPPPTPKENDKLAGSALPRRRLGTTTNTRLGLPGTVMTTPTLRTTPSKRYFDRTSAGRDPVPEAVRIIEDRPQRQFSLTRTGSLTRRITHRPSMIATSSTTTTNYHR
ncbi:hypothetical protein GGS21DRAFT_474285 [Xylaria nigripes]|nr:hypothetical protein GGS21DRAFT_474285 [Xylaria nigripes]